MTFEVRLAPASNTFEIAQGDQLTVSGKIFVPEEPLSVEDQRADHPSRNGDEGVVELSQKDAYKELRLRGYEYGGLFQGIVKAKNDGKNVDKPYHAYKWSFHYFLSHSHYKV